MTELNFGEIAGEAIKRYHALQKQWELSKFLEVIYHRDPKAIVEIGTSKGGTLWAMAKVLQGPRTFVCADMRNGPFGGSSISDAELTVLILSANPEAKIYICRGDSQAVKLPENLRADLVFIDGDHCFNGVWADWNRYMPLTSPGGMVVFHDIVEHPLETGVEVSMLWKMLKPTVRTHEIIEANSGSWAGIGIVYV